MKHSYERIKEELQRLRSEGRIGDAPSDKERADWAFGTTKIENDKVTRSMAESAVEKKNEG